MFYCSDAKCVILEMFNVDFINHASEEMLKSTDQIILKVFNCIKRNSCEKNVSWIVYETAEVTVILRVIFCMEGIMSPL
jgi:hypothetical protein